MTDKTKNQNGGRKGEMESNIILISVGMNGPNCSEVAVAVKVNGNGGSAHLGEGSCFCKTGMLVENLLGE